MSDAQLIERHDAAAESTVVGTKFYLDELAWRKEERIVRRSLEISQSVKHMTVVILFLTVVNVMLVAASIF